MLGAEYDTLSLEINDTETRQRALVTPPRLVVEPSDLAPIAARSEKAVAPPPVPPQPQRTEPASRPASGHAPAQPPQSRGVAPAHETAAAPAVLPKDAEDERLQGISYRRLPAPDACRRSSSWWRITLARPCPVSRTTFCAPFLSRPEASIQSRTSGTSSPGWTRRSACASTSPSSPARSPRRLACLITSNRPTTASASFAQRRELTRSRCRHRATRFWRCWIRSAEVTGPSARCRSTLIAFGCRTIWRRCCKASMTSIPAKSILSDNGLVKLFRLLRLARRLLELEVGIADGDGPPP